MSLEALEGNKVVGIKQSRKAVQSGEASAAYVARDADGSVVEPFVELCGQNGVDIAYVDSMKELGKMCRVDVPTAVCVILTC